MTQHNESNSSLLMKVIIISALLLILLLVSNSLKAQGAGLAAVPTVLKTGSTDPQQINLTVTGTSDPAGHSCCVIAPPSLIEVFLLEGELVFRNAQTGSPIPWLDFDPVPLDSNLEFIAQNRATVAGFSNILTVLSGNVTQDGITGSFTIGADGGLPSGAPIVYDFSAADLIGAGITVFEPRTAFLSLSTDVGFGFTIEDIPAEEKKPENFYLTLDTGVGGTDGDWWLLMLIGGELFSFDINTGTFVPGVKPTYTGVLLDIPEPIKFWTFSEPPNKQFTVFFGVDAILDLLLNEEALIGTGFTYYY